VWAHAVLVSGSLLTCCVVLELGLRLASPPPQGTPIFANFRTHIGNRTAPLGSYVRSAHLGWEMRPSHSYELGGCRHDVDARGYRSNDNVQHEHGEVRILAVGDSFTFGHRLSNRETWPSVLERERGVRVVNAGVSGYGLDQMLLQTQRSLRTFPTTRTVLVALISDDVERIRHAVRAGIAKPWYQVDGHGALDLIPANHAALEAEGGNDFVRTVLGHSYLAHRILRRAWPGYWNQGTWYDYRDADIDIARVARLIVDAFVEEVVRRHEADLVFVLLPASPSDAGMVTPAVDRPAFLVASHMAEIADREPGVFVADLQSELIRRFPDGALRRALYHDEHVDPAGHFNARGARLVASILMNCLDDTGAVIEGALDRYRFRGDLRPTRTITTRPAP
jgi:hypothetical protein